MAWLFCRENDHVCFFLLGLDSFLIYKITHIYVLWVHKNIVHGTLFSCVGCPFWVLRLVVVSAISSCITIGHLVVLSSEGRLNHEGDIWVPTGGCHICPQCNNSDGITFQKLITEKQMLDTIIPLRPLSSFTQTSFESNKIYMAKASILDSSVSMHFFVHNLVQTVQAYPWFDMNVGSFGLLLYQQ